MVTVDYEPKSPRIYLASTAELAATVKADVTIGAEYGSYVAEGAKYTSAHRQESGPYQSKHLGGSRPSPCNDKGIPVFTEEEGVVLLSRLDLDSIGGALRTIPCFQDLFDRRNPVPCTFWNLVESVDYNGIHTVKPSNAYLATLHAFYAFLETHRLTPNRNELQNVAAFIHKAGSVLRLLLAGVNGVSPEERERRNDLYHAGHKWKEQEGALNKKSYRYYTVIGNGYRVMFREAGEPVNHLYRNPEGTFCDAIVTLRTDLHACMVSLASPILDVSCVSLVRDFWPRVDVHLQVGKRDLLLLSANNETQAKRNEGLNALFRDIINRHQGLGEALFESLTFKPSATGHANSAESPRESVVTQTQVRQFYLSVVNHLAGLPRRKQEEEE